MADPTISLNRKVTDPNLSDLLEAFKKQVFLSFNSHHLAIVKSFDPETQTISAQIAYKKSFLRLGENGIYRMELVDYPAMIDVPVVILQGGAANLTFPIAAGDECLILFNDRDMDNYLQTGQVTGVASGRLHSFADGIALVGFNSTPNRISNYDAVRAVLSNADAMVGVGPSKVKIANDLYTLNGLLQDLVTEIKNLVSATASITVLCAGAGLASGAPLNAATINAVASALTATATQIAGLLE